MKLKEGKLYPKCDRITRKINGLILRIPRAGTHISKLYLWKYMVFNSMFIGGCGMIINYLLYEGFFRVALIWLWAGTFLAWVITTFIVFFWNYLWTKNWIINIKNQLLNMKKGELEILQEKIQNLLASKFDKDGKRIGWQ